MKDVILHHLKQIEKLYQVKILFATEVGSRAWGMANDSSDFDVRFIYVHPLHDYLTIDPIGVGKKKDTINKSDEENLDIHGWELCKSLRLLRKSNPSLLEWFHSPTIYYQAYSTSNWIRQVLPEVFQQKTCIFHYINMAKANLNTIIKMNEYDIKIVINVIRPLVMAKWIEEFNQFPPLNFHKLTQIIVDEEIKHNMIALVQQKINPHEYYLINFPLLIDFSKNEIERLETSAQKISMDNVLITEKLNIIFRNTIHEVENE